MRTLILVIFISIFSTVAYADWGIDFSRRQQDLIELEKQKQVYKEEKKSVLDMVTDRQAPRQDLAIIYTKDGWAPKNVQIKRGQRYRVHLANLNKKNKNLSFMMDAYSQHHGMYFGEEVVFEIEPRREGMFDFQCPETGEKGKFVVISSDSRIESPLDSIKLSRPASE